MFFSVLYPKYCPNRQQFFDKYILAQIGKDAQKLTKVISTAQGKMPVQTGDAFLVWRLKCLVNEGRLTVQGDWTKGWKEITIQLPSA